MPQTEDHLLLERVADVLDTVTSERGWGQPPLLLRLQGGLDLDGRADLGLRELDGHPAQSLLGFSAPLSWTALGVSAEGWATPCTEGPHGYRVEAAPGAARTRVRSLVLLGHRGEAVGRLRWEDGRCLTEAPTEGLVIDCLRRALGRRTPPPATSTDVLFATMWLENVLAPPNCGAPTSLNDAETPQSSRRLTWRQACVLHPAVQLLAQGPAQDGRTHSGEDVVAMARSLGRVCGWTMVRQQVMQGWKAGLDPKLATWMDAGMVSRWLLDRRPGLDDLLEHLAGACSPSVLRRVRQSLVALGIDIASDEQAEHPDVA